MPAGGYLGASLHSGAQHSIGVWNRNPRIECARIAVQSRQRAYDRDLPVKSARWKSVELDARLLPDADQRDIALIDGHIDQRLGIIDDIGEGVAKFQLSSHQVLDVRRGHNAIDGRAHLRMIEPLLGARHFRRPVIGLGLLDAGLGSIIGREGTIHQRDGDLALGLRRRQRRAIVPILEASQHLALVNCSPSLTLTCLTTPSISAPR